MKILAVDDDDADLEIFCESISLIDPQITCITLKKGDAALAYLQEATLLPDLIFLDINMPGLNGKELLKLIRTSTRLAELKVVMLSTSDDERDIHESKQLQADYLVKPASFTVLVSSLRDILDRHRN